MVKQKMIQLIGWSLIALMVLLIKHYYSEADANDLQWLLHPLVAWLELISPLSFEKLNGGEWLDARHHITIVTACAGVNFFIISLLGYLWMLPLNEQPIKRLLIVFSAAWLTTLLANSLRILLSVYAAETLANRLNLSHEDVHRLIGIFCYFLTIGIQLSTDRRRTFGSALLIAAPIYLTVTLLIPLFRSWMNGHCGINPEHAIWVICIPMGLVLFANCCSAFIRRMNGRVWPGARGLRYSTFSR